MKKSWLFALALFFLSAASFAEPPGNSPQGAHAAFLTALAGGPCGAPSSGVVFAAKGGATKSACSATANCASGTVSCNGNNNCAAYDNDCPSEQGHVTCDGVTTWCPTACCTTGTFRERACCRCGVTGDCVDCMVCEFGFEIPNYC